MSANSCCCCIPPRGECCMWRQMSDNCRALLALHKKSAFNRFPKLIFSRLKPMSFAVSHQAFIMKAWNVVDPRMFFWAQRKIDQSERVSTNFTPPYHPSKPFPSIIVFQRACSIPVLANVTQKYSSCSSQSRNRPLCWFMLQSWIVGKIIWQN